MATTKHKWSAPELLGHAETTVQRYIVGGRYGAMGTPRRSDWSVVDAIDGQRVSEKDPFYNRLTMADAMRKAEMLQEQE